MKTKNKINFTCQVCRINFIKSRLDYDALKEYQTLFPECQHHKDVAILCDDCHKQFIIWFDNLPDEVREKMKKEAIEHN